MDEALALELKCIWLMVTPLPHDPAQVEEVLLLWDRVIGLDSLLPVALLAVAVVCFRWGFMSQGQAIPHATCLVPVCQPMPQPSLIDLHFMANPFPNQPFNSQLPRRRQVILSCAAAKEVLDAMSDLTQLRTVPLLQAVLFQG